MPVNGKSKIVVRLDPQLLHNPDADIRYALADRLADVSGGAIEDDGYDYGPGDSPQLFIYLAAANLESSVAQVIQFLQTERMFENDLSLTAIVAVESDGGYRVVHPPDFAEDFTVPK